MNYRLRLKVLIVSVCTAFGLAACTSGDSTTQPDEDTQQATTPVETPTPSSVSPQEGLAIGDLQSVDLTGMSFVLKNALGNEQQFYFSDSTEIVGVPAAQGLTGKKGSEIRVRYAPKGQINMATWIDVSAEPVGAQPDTSPQNRSQ